MIRSDWPPHRHFFNSCRFLQRSLSMVALCALASAAQAQLSLPVPAQLPLHGVTEPIDSTLQRTTSALQSQVGVIARTRQISDLLRQHRDVLDTDAHGALIVRGQVVALALSPDAAQQIQREGFRIVGTQVHAALDLQLTILAAPAGVSARAALRRLRKLDPAGSYDFNHLYLPSAGETPGEPVPADSAISPPAGSPLTSTPVSVGLIDGGVDTAHPALIHADVYRWGCRDQPVPSLHGTATASLLIGSSRAFEGAAPGASLYAADVYCAAPTGGAVNSIAAACAWLVESHVPVINISLVGPANRLLEQVVQRVIARGHIVVAAVGNDGPAAAPLYPAAYAGVVGVTAVNRRNRVLIEAVRGEQVDYAAPGADIVAATLQGDFAAVRGTSFAAPIVAGLLAASMPRPDRALADRALTTLAASAIDLGSPGPDRIYGAGLVGAIVRDRQTE